MNDHDLLAWAISVIRRAQDEKVFGVVHLRLENGRITHATTERTEKPLQVK